ncbi:MAG: alpha/beta fold hydrolase [Fibrobacter sp.]|jgi:pimeloyl-ACP methyl ester carboxylesterase|nr:alpha/beta fold hydrolase [Fibrobacter sp.]
MTFPVLAFCGMPGTAADLEILRNAAGESSCDLQIYGVASMEEAVIAGRGKIPVCVGYSRGCRNAMRYALQYPAAGVLLIAPHWGNRISPLLRVLLHIPVLGTFLLRKVGPERIRKMLRETAFPEEIPEAYGALENIYAQPSVLRSALLSPAHSMAEAEFLAQSLQVPVHAIAGGCDKALFMAEALRPRLKCLTVIPQAGHALPWTHGKECVKALKELMENL